MIKLCTFCNNQLKYGNKFCSQQCYWSSYRTINFKCIVCSKALHVRPFRVKKGIKYCSTECRYKVSSSWNKGLVGVQHHTEKTRKKIAKSLTGPRNYAWQGGITPAYAQIRNGVDYKIWRDKVYRRDNYTCVVCGSKKSGTLNADHIQPFSLYPELRLEVDNGRTLCVPCHRKTPTYGNYSRRVREGYNANLQLQRS